MKIKGHKGNSKRVLMQVTSAEPALPTLPAVAEGGADAASRASELMSD